METQQETIRGLQLSAKYSDDIKREWNLCKDHCQTLEALSITNDILHFQEQQYLSLTIEQQREYEQEHLTFPCLQVLEFFAIAQYKLNYQKRKYGFDFKHFQRYIVEPFQKFLTNNRFPVLKEVRIHFTPYTNFLSIGDGGISHYDKYGPVYDPEIEDELEYINLDVLFQYREKPRECIDWSFLNGLGIQTLTLGKTFHSLTKKMEYSFTIQESSFTSIDIDAEYKKIKEIFSTKYFVEKYFA